MQEMLTGAVEMERAKQEAMAGLMRRQPSLRAALPQARVTAHQQRIQELSAQAAQLHNAILAESTRQRPVSPGLHAFLAVWCSLTAAWGCLQQRTLYIKSPDSPSGGSTPSDPPQAGFCCMLAASCAQELTGPDGF